MQTKDVSAIFVFKLVPSLENCFSWFYFIFYFCTSLSFISVLASQNYILNFTPHPGIVFLFSFSQQFCPEPLL